MSEDIEPYLKQDLIGIVLQYLEENGYHDTMHKLEKESQYFFDFDYLRGAFIDGKLDEVIDYLSGFVPLTTREAQIVFFEILKLKYFGALDCGDKASAATILKDEIRPFFNISDDADQGNRKVIAYNEFVSLLGHDDFRKHKSVVWFGTARETRKHIFQNIEIYLKKKVPVIRERFKRPAIPERSRLLSMINQSFNFHVTQPADRQVIIQTLFTDHDFYSDKEVTCGNYYFSKQAKLRGKAEPESLDDDLLPPLSNMRNYMTLNGGSKKRLRDSNDSIGQNKGREKRRRRSRNFLDDGLHGAERGIPMRDKAILKLEKQAKKYKPPTDELYKIHPSNNNVNISNIAFHPNISNLLLVNNLKGSISLWDISRNISVHEFCTNLTGSMMLRWSPDGCYIAIAHIPTGEICKYRFDADKLIILPVESSALFLHNNSKISVLEFARIGKPSRKTLTANVTLSSGAVSEAGVMESSKKVEQIILQNNGGEDHCLYGSDLEGKVLYKFVGHTGTITTACVVICENVPVLISTSLDGTMMAWVFPCHGDEDELPIMVYKQRSYELLTPAVNSMVFCKNRLFSCGAGENSFVEWDFNGGSTIHTYGGYAGIVGWGNEDKDDESRNKDNETVKPQYNRIIERNGNLILNCGSCVKFWNSYTGKVRKVLNPQQHVASFDLSVDGKYLALVLDSSSPATTSSRNVLKSNITSSTSIQNSSTTPASESLSTEIKIYHSQAAGGLVEKK